MSDFTCPSEIRCFYPNCKTAVPCIFCFVEAGPVLKFLSLKLVKLRTYFPMSSPISYVLSKGSFRISIAVEKSANHSLPITSSSRVGIFKHKQRSRKCKTVLKLITSYF